jgi:hypothetical protein
VLAEVEGETLREIRGRSGSGAAMRSGAFGGAGLYVQRLYRARELWGVELWGVGSAAARK